MSFKKSLNAGGNGSSSPDFSIHMNTCWRITRRGRLVFGSADSGSWKTYSERQHIHSSTRETMLEFLKKLGKCELLVTRASLSHRYDLKIYFSHGYVLTAFGLTNSNDEFWRFLRGEPEDQWILTARDGFINTQEQELPVDDTGQVSQADWIAGETEAD